MPEESVKDIFTCRQFKATNFKQIKDLIRQKKKRAYRAFSSFSREIGFMFDTWKTEITNLFDLDMIKCI